MTRKLISQMLLMFLSVTLLANGNGKRNPSVDVVRYLFEITLGDQNDTITAKATIQLKIVEPADSVRLDLRNVGAEGRGMTVTSLTVNGRPVAWTHVNDKVSLPLPPASQPGGNLQIEIGYRGIPGNGLVIAATKFGKRGFFGDHWPDRGSHYLPCIDHVSDKAAVEFIITAPDHYTVVANGSLIKEQNLRNGTKLTHWREDTPIPVKVMTFGAAEFAVEKAGSVAGIPVWTYVYPENREAGFSDYALALKAVEYYSDLIGPYPYPKLANVQSKTMFGGLENAGCIFYSENSVTGTGRSEGLIAHEIAHQWFGNSVTEADWHHVWLSEGFATYLTSMYWEMKEGTARLGADMRSARERVLRASASAPKPVIDTTVTDLMRLLSANSYQKGAWVLHMLRNHVGDAAFNEGLRLYYARFRDSNALTSDFCKVMEEVSGLDLEWFFHQWLWVAGQPDLKTEWTYDSVAGQVQINITQAQDYLFRFPLEMVVQIGGQSKRVNIDISERTSKIVVEFPVNPENIVTDPDVRLLFREVSAGR